MFKKIADISMGVAIAIVLAGGVHYGASSLASYAANDPTVFSQSVVQLGKFCSGTVIEDPTGKGKPTILTARHCIDAGAEIIDITLPTINERGQTVQEDTIKFDVVRISEKSDLALLQTDSKLFNLPPLPVYQGTLETGYEVFAVGYPSGGVLTVTSGFIGPIEKVPAFYAISKSGEFRRSSTLVAPGSSGGGLIMETTFGGPQLVGVATGMNMRYQFQTFWSPIEEIRDFLKEQSFEEVIEANE